MLYGRERKDAAAAMRRLYYQNLTTCSGGNISLRVDKNRFIITPSGLDKALITARNVAVMVFSGENLTPKLKPSIETSMHEIILSSRADINAVVHAHPKHATFFTAAQSHHIRTDLIAEARYLLGEPAFAAYELMGTTALGNSAAAALAQGAVAVLLENHGIITVGKTLLQAFDRMEVLESAAEMTLMAAQIGDISPLGPSRLKEIDEMHTGAQEKG